MSEVNYEAAALFTDLEKWVIAHPQEANAAAEEIASLFRDRTQDMYEEIEQHLTDYEERPVIGADGTSMTSYVPVTEPTEEEITAFADNMVQVGNLSVKLIRQFIPEGSLPEQERE